MKTRKQKYLMDKKPTNHNSTILPNDSLKKKKVSHDNKMQQIYDELIEEYGPALEKLAK